MEKEEFIRLSKKYSENNATSQEADVVESFFDNLQNSKLDKIASPSADTAFRIYSNIKIKASLPEVNLKNNYSDVLQIAAAFIIISALVYTFLLQSTPVSLITQTAKKGEQKEIRLMDGSIVHLNSNSAITYAQTFTDVREIKLSGEAYFKVTRDTSKPFIVSTHDIKVRVLGTSFNINSYDNASRVNVLSGRVEVSSPSGKKIILTKDQHATLDKTVGFIKSIDNAEDDIAWTKNTILLKNTTLKETARIIENRYNTTIYFETADLEKLTISGKFRDEKLENVLESIALLKNLEIIYQSKKHVLIRKKHT